MVTVLVLTASLTVAVVIQNGEWVRRGHDAGLVCQNADAVPGGAEKGGGSRAPFTLPAPVVRFSCSRKGAAVIVNVTTSWCDVFFRVRRGVCPPSPTTLLILHWRHSVFSSDPPYPGPFSSKVIHHHFCHYIK